MAIENAAFGNGNVAALAMGFKLSIKLPLVEHRIYATLSVNRHLLCSVAFSVGDFHAL
jgi:hypothetical protein